MAPLYLIDGHNVLYRTFYGIPRLSAPDGTPTNAILGVARILLKILREDRPAAIAAVFDSREPTPRHNLYPEYKATRLSIPEELAAQIPLVMEVIDALGIPRIQVPGAEADDIIGTLSRMAEDREMEVVIVSSDKDLYQLVSPGVRVRDGLKEKIVGEAEVRDTFGVAPSQVPDLLALSGDPSDNVPGVPGIGEKTAAELIREFGTLSELLAHTDRLKGSRREKIEKNAGSARMCLTLVTIDRALPLKETLEDLALRPMQGARVSSLFRKLGFRKLLEDLKLDAGPELPLHRAVPPSPRKWNKVEAASELFAGAAGEKPAGASIADGGEGFAGVSAPGRGTFVIPVAEVPRALARLQEGCGRIFLYDGKSFFRRHGGLPDRSLALFDLQVAGYLLEPDEGTPALAKLVARYLPSAVGEPEEDAPEARAARSAETLLAMGLVFEGRLSAAGLSQIFYDVDMPLLPVLYRMEEAGIRIAPEIFRNLSKELSEGTRQIEEKVARIAGADFNINSPKQLSFLLFEKL
ncbi:MAG TPA: 5'-3' exonuclease H3TH domain-containing protein, partial [Candidatus Deferrimicrobiaceae bacterium]|nr:5'-3' exonuclease H3TH domain-containing protein [Candidatus Deferrimicrobiaceae bacterium]